MLRHPRLASHEGTRGADSEQGADVIVYTVRLRRDRASRGRNESQEPVLRPRPCGRGPDLQAAGDTAPRPRLAGQLPDSYSLRSVHRSSTRTLLCGFETLAQLAGLSGVLLHSLLLLSPRAGWGTVEPGGG